MRDNIYANLLYAIILHVKFTYDVIIQLVRNIAHIVTAHLCITVLSYINLTMTIGYKIDQI